MTVRTMRHLPDPVLRQKAKKVSHIDGSVQRLIDSMIKTMQWANGVELAAPQLGVPLRVIVLQMPEEEPIVLINPEIIKKRNSSLSEISRSLRHRLHQQQIGQVLEVISEYGTNADGALYGISDNYIRVKLPLTTDSGKEIVKVRITDSCEDFVSGEIISDFTNS